MGGWLLVYLAGSVPVTLFLAAGLAGRFLDYQRGAVAGIFIVLAVPLVLASEKYDWLNRTVFIGKNKQVPRKVAYDIFRIL